MESISSKYKVFLFPRAYREIEWIYAYISHEILETKLAKKQIDRIWEKIESLSTFPHAHQDRPVGRYSDKGYKRLLIDNYIAVFRINEDKKEVYVVTVQYAGRNL